MAERWVGFVATGASVLMVDADMPDSEDDPIIINADQTWPLQKGDPAEAYHVLYQHCTNYLQENEIDVAVVKGSAALVKGMGLAHLTGAEVRGVVIAAAASVCPVRIERSGQISRTYGNRKFDQYLKDDDFWEKHTAGGKLRVGSRAGAMILLASRNS